MEWTELTPLSIDNLNGMESRISAADAAIIAGKLNTYNAIVTKGITPTSQDFADLVAAINLLSTGNALVSEVLSGKTFSNASGPSKTGTMPNRGAVTISPAIIAQTIANGYHNGGGVVKASYAFVAGDLLIKQLGDGSTAATTPTTVSSAVVRAGGVIRVKYIFRLAVQEGYVANCRIYVNNVPVGVLRQSSSMTNVTYTEDISVDRGDVIQLKAWMTSTNGSAVALVMNATLNALENTLAV